jgi:CubicO group peptidase (beta-lactamase class C family)
MTSGGFSRPRLSRLHDVLAGHVAAGALPGLVTLLDRKGETVVDTIGTMAFGGHAPMRRDTIFRIASMTKPVVAVAAMILVEECRLRLHEPVDALLPELADRRVLKNLEGPVDDTVPAVRPITLRDLLTFRAGMGALMAPPGTYPIQAALAEAGLAVGPMPIQHSPDEWIRRLGTLPLLHQPGTSWRYHTASDVLGVLIARASGQPLETFLRERLFEPLGMKDTGFYVPPDKLHRLPHGYGRDRETGELKAYDDPADSHFAQPPPFPSGGGGLVSTADDYLAFCRMMLGKGRLGDVRILARPTVELMTVDHLTPEQKVGSDMFFSGGRGWGFGMGVANRRETVAGTPGRFGWDGGFGTSGYMDPAEDMVGILLTQRMMDSPQPPVVFSDFWTGAYAAIDD